MENLKLKRNHFKIFFFFKLNKIKKKIERKFSSNFLFLFFFVFVLVLGMKYHFFKEKYQCGYHVYF